MNNHFAGVFYSCEINNLLRTISLVIYSNISKKCQFSTEFGVTFEVKQEL